MPTEAFTCPGCRASFAAVSGPVHAYIGASPACWAVYGDVLAREYGDPRYFGAHRLTVDTYAVQHPGAPSRRAIRSVCLHLVCLHLALEQDWPAGAITRHLQAVTRAGLDLEWLPPPDAPGALTVQDVAATADATGHVAAVHAWAECVWRAWAAHHSRVRSWAAA